jgi:hypothetical protein
MRANPGKVAAEFRFGVQGSGFRVRGSGFGVQGSGFRVQGSGFDSRNLLLVPLVQPTIVIGAERGTLNSELGTLNAEGAS